METLSAPISRARKSQMYLSRFSTRMFELEISTTLERSAKRLSVPVFIETVAPASTAPLPKRLFVQRRVFPRRGAPRVVLFHRPAYDPFPPRAVGVGRK